MGRVGLRFGSEWLRYATALVVVVRLALVAVFVALVSGDSAALATLVVVIVALRGTATVRHLLTAPDGQHRRDVVGQGPPCAVRH